MGLTKNGFIRRTYDDILNDKIRRAKELFGEDIDTSDLTLLGKFIRISAYDQAIAEEEIERVYYSRFPNTASGQSLDRLLPFVGITRNPATAAVYKVKVEGEPNHVIEAGFLVGTETGLTYCTNQEYTIDENGICEIEVSCTEAGTIGNLSSAKAICSNVNLDAQINTAIGVEILTAGEDEESDADLRKRFAAAVSGSGSCNENAIRSSLLRIPTVQFVAVIANNTNETDSEGRPPHSFECYVLGGEEYEQEIGEVIFKKRPIGIQTVGDNAVTIIDATGKEKVVYYTTAPKVMITVRAVVKATSAFPEDGVAQAQKAVTDYINDLGIGNSLVLSSIYGYIYSVIGVKEVVTLELSTDGGNTYSAANVEVPEYGIAVCSSVVVEVKA